MVGDVETTTTERSFMMLTDASTQRQVGAQHDSIVNAVVADIINAVVDDMLAYER